MVAYLAGDLPRKFQLLTIMARPAGYLALAPASSWIRFCGVALGEWLTGQTAL
jgi:hypothetical protein